MGTGSVRSRDPEGTKRLVLDAAERLFAERGFAGTSIRDVAVASGVSHPLIQHHFVTKEGLYRAVLGRCGEEYDARFPVAPDDAGRPIDLREEMTRMFAFVREQGRLMRMIGWARLEGRADLFDVPNCAREAMIRRIEASQHLGSIRADIPAASLMLMIKTLIFSHFENRDLHAVIDGGVPDDATYLDQAIRLVERGVATGHGSKPMITGPDEGVGSPAER